MSTIGEALDRGAAKFYGPGYDDLPLEAKYHVRERVLPIFNAMFPIMRDSIAVILDERAATNEMWDRKAAAEAFRSAAAIARTWPS